MINICELENQQTLRYKEGFACFGNMISSVRTDSNLITHHIIPFPRSGVFIRFFIPVGTGPKGSFCCFLKDADTSGTYFDRMLCGKTIKISR